MASYLHFKERLAIFIRLQQGVLYLWIFSALLVPLNARLSPHAPVREFKLPRFAENGYTDWVLQGSSGHYVSPELIHISDMALRIYSADERMLRELALESAFAALHLQENTAQSTSPIRIEGNHFKVGGIGWNWDGTVGAIEVLSDVTVDFQQSITPALRTVDSAEALSSRTTHIQSQQLQLQTNEEQHRFTFKDSVQVNSDSMQMRTGQLEVTANLPSQGPDTASPNFQAPQDLSAIHNMQASRGVEIIDQNRRIVSDQALFEPPFNRAYFTGGAQVEFPGIQLKGDRMETSSGAIQIFGSQPSSPAKMHLQQRVTVVESEPQDATTSLVEVLAQRIEIEEQTSQIRLRFTDRVRADSEGLQLKADALLCRVNQSQAGTSMLKSTDAAVQFADMERLQASGSVEVFLHQQHAQADAMDYDPATATTYLSGRPRLSQGLYQVSGHSMQLNRQASLIQGTPDQRVHAFLPPLEASTLPQQNLTESDSQEAAATPLLATEITSLHLKHAQDAEQTVFEFAGHVRITGTDLEAQCERLIVYAVPQADVSGQLSIERMEAIGDVQMVYEGRSGRSDVAEFDCIRDQLILTGNAQLEDASGLVSGHKITYNQGVGVQVEADPARKQRNTIQLLDSDLTLP
jgi:lipopolysaccharide export system protein LptA